MKRKIFFIVIFATAFFSVTDIYGAEKWSLVKNENGIRVYTKPVAGSDLDEFLGVTAMDARLDVILKVMEDIPAGPKWLFNCKESRLLKKINRQTHIIYNATKAPWPIDDRDVVIKSVTEPQWNKGKVIIRLNSIRYDYPKREDHVRMPALNGAYVLAILGMNKTRVTYRIKANPGGSLPAWLANLASKAIPFHTLAGLRRMAQEPKYVKAAEFKDKVESYLKSLPSKTV